MHTRLLQLSAGLAAALVVAMFVIFLVTGVGQEGLQVFSPPEAWAALLVVNPAALRLTLGLDDAFIVAYTTTFIALALVRWPARGARPLTVIAVALLAVTGLLDLLENFDFLVRLNAMLAGFTPSVAEVESRVVASLLKFHLSYLGLWLLGHALPRTTRLERVLGASLRWLQLPVGLAIPLVPRAVAVPLVVVRFLFFFFALLALRAASKREGFTTDDVA